MSHFNNIQRAQEKLEEICMKRMDELEAQLHAGSSSKETVAKVSEELRTFRLLMFKILSVFRQQIRDGATMTDGMETRHRKKALLFLGIPESEREDCTAVLIDVIANKIGLTDITASSIRTCHRLGARNSDRPRPILVRFECVKFRSAVWRAKTKLKGSSVTVKEFLTRVRQAIFTEARKHYGVRACWTQDGTIFVKVADGSRHRITTAEELKTLIAKHPAAGGESSSSVGVSGGSAGATIASSKTRKN